MKYKICEDCGKNKSVDRFYKNKSAPDGLFNICKGCRRVQRTKRERTKDGCLRKIHDSQKHTSKNKGFSPPSYSADWLVEWGMAQEKYHNMYDSWVKSGYNKWLRPSIDRIDDYKPYTKDNIQLMTWAENHEKERFARMSGKNNKGNIKTFQLTLDGELIKEYHSVRSAERQTGIFASNICACINGKQTHAGGYLWKH